MPSNSQYFMTFLAEMRGYLADMRQQIDTLASPTRAFADPVDAVRVLRRLGHTIASLGATLNVPDFAVLGSAMERLFAPLASGTTPVPRSIGSTLLRAAIYIELRLGAMDSAEQFIAPDGGEMEEARRIASALERAGAAIPQASGTAPAQDPVDRLDEADLAREVAAMPEEVRAVLSAFLNADLVASVPDRPTAPIGTDDDLSDFVAELHDDLEAMRAALVEMQRASQPQAALRRLAELTHKIKGAAYMVGLQGIGGVAELSESLLTALRQRQVAVSAAAVSWLITATDALDALGRRVVASGGDGGGASELARLHEGLAAIMALPMTANAAGTAAQSGDLAPAAHDRSPMRVNARRIGYLTTALSMMMRDRKQMLEILRGTDMTLDELGRVIERLTDLSQRLNAEWLAKGAQSGRATTMQDALPTLRHATPPPALAQWIERHRAHPAASRDAADLEMEQFADFDILIAMVDESIVDLRGMHLALQTAANGLRRLDERHASQVTTSQRDLLNITLAPLTELVPHLSLAVQSAAMQEGKAVAFEATVSGCELDRDSWETLKEPLAQLVRNAVAHGIETPQERSDARKAEPARVTVRASYTGDRVMIVVADNGRGINPHQVVTAALAIASEIGLRLSTEQARSLSDEAALALIFQPGVSTAMELRPTAGHGIGLPNVQSAVESVGGTIRVASEIGRGTTFTISVPVSQRLTRVRLVHAGSVLYAVPVASITRIIPGNEMRSNGAAQGHYVLRELLGLASSDAPSHVLVVVDAGMTLGIWVDSLSDERELITHPPPNHLRQRGVRGAAVTAEGEMVLLLDLAQAVQATTTWRRGNQMPAVAAPQPIPAPDVLVVDDSPTLRDHLVATLVGAGLTVGVARDGLEAMEQLHRAVPRLIILDVEMPRLNGYELLDVLRAQPRWQQVPVIMLTSRAAPRYRSVAIERGAVEYLVKPCPADQLIAAVTRCMRG